MMRVLDGLERRVERAGLEGVAGLVDRMAAAVREAGGIRVEQRGEAIVLSGRGLMRRWLSDATLRFAMWRRG